MSGEFNSIQAAVRDKLALALYVHYSPHCFSLAVSDACNVSPIRNCMGTIQSLHTFFNITKPEQVLKSSVETATPLSKRKQLKKNFVQLFVYQGMIQ